MFNAATLHAAIPAAERNALIAFYNSTDGDNWKNNSGWKDGTLEADGFGPVGSEASWYGVTVENDHVTRLYFYANRLTGDIPKELENLQQLRFLDLKFNELSGSIPIELGNLQMLEVLILDYNDLTGGIPKELEYLSQLTELSLTGNRLGGTIPPELGNLSQLAELMLTSTGLSGSIPPELENLARLRILKLDTNALSGSIPKELGNLPALEHLFLGGNRLTGSIPAELGKLGNLKWMHFYKNQLSGPIPPELGNLQSLQYLFLDDNTLSGSIPKELGKLGNLIYLRLQSNQLSGSIPPELGNLGKLVRLFVQNNRLSGNIPPELGNLDRLEWLYVQNNQLSGSIPPELENLSSVSVISLAKNRLTGSIPKELGNLGNVTTIYLENNRLSGTIPPELTRLTNLYNLFLSSNRLVGRIPSGFKHLTKLSSLAIGYNALYTDDAELRAFLNRLSPDWGKTQSSAPPNVSAAGASNSSIMLSWTPIIYTGDSGGYNIYYSTSPTGPWDFVTMTANKSVSSYEITGLSYGTRYYFVIETQTDPHYYNENTVISEYSMTASASPGTPLPEKDPPFGSFDTPINGSTAAGSIAVTGWALDDSGVEQVKIYRQAGNRSVYIGDAVFVEGARPDVAQLYPGYPDNTRAGWGYMLLTNFLPGGGNGTVVLEAVATDVKGKTTALGTKTILCDNDNAVKPFGAIDTPAQGGIASGSKFLNWGWALTPWPNTIPTDGSTIDVWVDGVKLGHPTYNLYRVDIATLFPGYANSEGAVGYYYLDTTVYQNGVHTIQWTVKDDANNTDGIGSRYFTIRNQNKTAAQTRTMRRPHVQWDISQIPRDYSTPLAIRKGYDLSAEPQIFYPDDQGDVNITIGQLERLEIQFADEIVNITPLPPGSTMTDEGKRFCWQPGAASLGKYRLVFLYGNKKGMMMRKEIYITIVPIRRLKMLIMNAE
jgi:Leucine-rich repeat (LRR) protein